MQENISGCFFLNTVHKVYNVRSQLQWSRTSYASNYYFYCRIRPKYDAERDLLVTAKFLTDYIILQ